MKYVSMSPMTFVIRSMIGVYVTYRIYIYDSMRTCIIVQLYMSA